MDYQFHPEITSEIEVPRAGITSRTLYQSDRVRVVVFGFAAGEELSEHTAAVPAIIHVLDGEGSLTFDGKYEDVTSGAWVHMDAHLPHSVFAKTELRMVLYLLRSGK